MTNELCCAKLEDGNVVSQIIVGDAAWAEANLGGRWVSFERDAPGKTYPTIDAVYDEATDDFINPVREIDVAS